MENFDDTSNVLRLRSTGYEYANRDIRFDSIICRDKMYEKFKIPECYGQWRVVVSTLGCSAHLMRMELRRGFFRYCARTKSSRARDCRVLVI